MNHGGHKYWDFMDTDIAILRPLLVKSFTTKGNVPCSVNPYESWHFCPGLSNHLEELQACRLLHPKTQCGQPFSQAFTLFSKKFSGRPLIPYNTIQSGRP